MSKFLTKFETTSAYDAARGSLNKPNVSYIVETLGVAYNPVLVPEMVDLGLPTGTLWMAYNLGAEHGDTKESWYGDFYAFGETQGYTASQVGTDKNFVWDDYEMVTRHIANFTRDDAKDIPEFSSYKAYTSGTETYYFYYGPMYVATYDAENHQMVNITGGAKYSGSDLTDVYLLDPNITSLDATHDVISATFGTSYHMPTKDQIQELIDETNHTWETNYNGISGLNGRVFTSKTDSSKSIFIPAAGYANDGSVCSVDSYCSLWSREVNSDNPRNAWYLYFNSGSCYVSSNNRCNGLSVRGVK